MKKLLGIAAIAILAATAVRAIWVYNAYLVNEPSLAYSKNYVLNLNTTPNASGIARLTAQAVYSSATLPTDTFNDGRVSTAAITVVTNSGLVAAFATDQITVAADAVIKSSASYNSLVVNSTNNLTGATITMNSTVVPNNGWRIDTAAHTATDIAAELNTYVYPVIASASGSTISLIARTNGTAGNAFTLVTSTPTALAATYATFVGGQNPAFQNQSITVNGMVYPRAYYWNQPTSGATLTSTGTAVSIASLLNTISGIQAHASGSVVYATATVSGAAANLFTIVSSTPAALTVASPTFTGGVSPAVVTINGVAVTVSTGASTTATAAAIASAINANSSLSSIVRATNVANVVNTTSTLVGTLSNYTLTSSTPAAISVSHPTYVGGQNASFSVGSPNLFIAAHGYTTGNELLLTGATQPAPLAAGTSYYAILVDANDLELATSLANAKAGTFITFTSSTTTGPHTSTLTPLLIAGTMGLQWQVSNDCVNYTNLTTTSLGVAVSSLTFGTPYTAGVTTWDLGPVNYQCLQAALTGPSAGGWAIKVNMNGSNP